MTVFDCAANWCGCGLAFEHSHLLPGFCVFYFLSREAEESGGGGVRSTAGRGSWVNVESFVIVLFNKKVQVGYRSCLQGLNSGFRLSGKRHTASSFLLTLCPFVLHIRTPFNFIFFNSFFIRRE